ncbi:MAG: ComF family protein [Kofleriaceae bacterium]|nr:ComF family protein [Kofleriaceae bacterium]
MLFLSKLQSRVLSTLYPELCAACESHLGPDVDGLCEVCQLSCEPIGAACPTCAKPSSAGRAISCATCTRQSPEIASCSAAYHYGGQLAVALKQLKYAKRSNIARTLRPLLQEQFSSRANHCDLGIAVPLHWRRLRKRGFNQAQRLLLPLASESKLKVVRNILVRTRDTQAQARLNARDRATNLQSAFQVRGQLHRQRILLLDDIVTTGSTLRAAARALRDAGARRSSLLCRGTRRVARLVIRSRLWPNREP